MRPPWKLHVAEVKIYSEHPRNSHGVRGGPARPDLPRVPPRGRAGEAAGTGGAPNGPGSPRGPAAPPRPPVTRAKPVSGPQSRTRAQDRAATAHPWVPGPPSCAPASRSPPGNRGRRRGPGRAGAGAGPEGLRAEPWPGGGAGGDPRSSPPLAENPNTAAAPRPAASLSITRTTPIACRFTTYLELPLTKIGLIHFFTQQAFTEHLLYRRQQ